MECNFSHSSIKKIPEPNFRKGCASLDKFGEKNKSKIWNWPWPKIENIEPWDFQKKRKEKYEVSF